MVPSSGGTNFVVSPAVRRPYRHRDGDLILEFMGLEALAAKLKRRTAYSRRPL